MINGTNILGNPVQTTEFYTINGTLPASTTWTDYYALPSTWTDIDKVVVLTLEWYRESDDTWRHGQAVNGESAMRLFIERNASGVRAYTNNTVFYSTPFRVTLAYLP